jgi:hypothetical protein
VTQSNSLGETGRLRHFPRSFRGFNTLCRVLNLVKASAAQSARSLVSYRGYVFIPRFAEESGHRMRQVSIDLETHPPSPCSSRQRHEAFLVQDFRGIGQRAEDVLRAQLRILRHDLVYRQAVRQTPNDHPYWNAGT